MLAVAFGFMLHIRNRERQKYSEVCRPLLGKHTDGICGRLIDLLAVFALIAGTTTTFSIATPLMSEILVNMFFGILLYVLLFGGRTRYIIESGISSLGTMMQNFVSLATYTDPLRTSYFPQNWTIYYWAYWMVWCVAAPFFIGSISRGRTVEFQRAGVYVR